MRRARALALLLDLLVCVGAADGAGLAVTAALWFWIPPARWITPFVWIAAGTGAVLAFLLRDASGGRARRWLGLVVGDARGKPPGAAGSIRRNLPLIVPLWNLWDAWPVLSNGTAQRRIDRGSGTRVTPSV